MGLGRTPLPTGGGGDSDGINKLADRFKSPLDRAPSPAPSPRGQTGGSITDSVRDMLDRVVDRTDAGSEDLDKVDSGEGNKGK